MRRSGYWDRYSTFSDPLATLTLSVVRPSFPVFRSIVKATEDRRFYHPMGDFRPAGALTKPSRRIIPQASTGGKTISPRLSFATPELVARCVRRKERREVLFAKGKSGGGHRKPRRDWFSDISCKR